MRISVIIPVYGCAKSLTQLHDRLVTAIEKLTNDFEIIMIDDGDPNNSWAVIAEICAKDKRVQGIELSRNFGQHNAIFAGLEHSSGDYVVVMDCDLQDKPEEIINLYRKIKEGYDVVFARRAKRQDNCFKVFVSKQFYKVYSYLTNVKYDNTIGNFSISKRMVINALLSMKDYHKAFNIYLMWVGFKTTAIDVVHEQREYGQTSYNFKKRVSLAVNILTSQSDKLLNLIAILGFFITICSLILGFAVIILKLNSYILPGWASQIALLCFLGGMIIFSIGILGIYLGKIFMQTKGRPVYIVRQVLNASAKNVKAEKVDSNTNEN